MINLNEEKFNIWDFIVDNYPNYDISDEICLNNDLSLIFEDEWENSEAVTEMLNDSYGGNPKNAECDYWESSYRILEKSIIAYIEKQNINKGD